MEEEIQQYLRFHPPFRFPGGRHGLNPFLKILLVHLMACIIYHRAMIISHKQYSVRAKVHIREFCLNLSLHNLSAGTVIGLYQILLFGRLLFILKNQGKMGINPNYWLREENS